MMNEIPEPQPLDDPEQDGEASTEPQEASEAEQQVDPQVEADSNWRPEGWVEGEQMPGETPEPIAPDDPAHPDNAGAPDPDEADAS